MALNFLTGQNVDPRMAIEYDWGTVWFFLALYRRHRRLLERLARMDAIGVNVMPGKLHGEVITELRRVYAMEKRLEATVDAAWMPHIETVMAEDGRHTPETGTKPGAAVVRLNRNPGTTITAPAPPKPTRGRPRKTTTKGRT